MVPSTNASEQIADTEQMMFLILVKGLQINLTTKRTKPNITEETTIVLHDRDAADQPARQNHKHGICTKTSSISKLQMRIALFHDSLGTTGEIAN